MAKILRPTRLDEKRRDELLADVEHDRKRLNKSVAELRRLKFEVNDTETLKAINPEWLRQYLTQQYRNFVGRGGAGFIPASTAERIRAEFDEVGRAADGHCSSVERILKRRNFSLKIDSKQNFWFDEKEVKQWATDAATRHFTDEEREYYTLLGEVAEVLNRVDVWEREHGIKSFVIHGRQIITPNGVSRRWLTDYLCRRNEHGAPVGGLELSPDAYIKLIGFEGLFPQKNITKTERNGE